MIDFSLWKGECMISRDKQKLGVVKIVTKFFKIKTFGELKKSIERLLRFYCQKFLVWTRLRYDEAAPQTYVYAVLPYLSIEKATQILKIYFNIAKKGP